MMASVFTITPGDIQKLNDEQSRELVARLCRAELKNRNISQDAVTWGGDQRAKDGGVDVRINIEPIIGIDGYIKRDRSVFQVKAEKFIPSKIPAEMALSGILRPAINELAKNNGSYIIVSTRDNLSDSSLSNRIEAMKECLSKYDELSGKVILDFYDCRRISDWVEQHPAIVIWIKDIIGKPLIGWKPYSPWAYQESDLQTEYLVDDRVKVFLPNVDEGIDVTSAINRLRSDLSKNISVRIVGLSGVGKTRLVQSLFDIRICTGSLPLDTGNVLYTDLSDNPIPQPQAMVEALASDGSDCVIVIDNCGADVHQRLTEIVKRSGSKLRLVTIEYDIRDDLPEGTVCYRLEGSSDNIIKQILKRRFKVLSDNDLAKIAEFSDGNARVALALASTTDTTGELARLRDSELFKRLFQQKQAEDQELLQCAEVASLLYSFNGEEISSDSEIAILALLAGVPIATFVRNISLLRQRGLVQSRGRWRAVLPHAISNRLAGQAMDTLPKNILIEALVRNAPNRVALSFSRRLSYMHESKAAREIVQDWLKPNGRYSVLENFIEIDRQIFANLAPVDQKAALEALKRATFNSDFVSTKNHHRSHFARITRSLAYETTLFDHAINILVKFAIAEFEDRGDSIRKILESLFWCHLSGTEALPERRAKIIRELIHSDEEVKQKIGLWLLASALKTDQFSSFYEFNFGARKRNYGWRPRTIDDIRAWYKLFMDIAVEAGKNNTAYGRDARAVLGESLRGLWIHAGMRNEITLASKALATIDGWPEGWLGLRRILRWDKDQIPKDLLQELLKLIQALTPRDLEAKIRARVLTHGSSAFDLDEDGNDDKDPATQYHRAQQETEDLGKIAARENKLLLALLPELLHNNFNNKIWNFGFGVGQEIEFAEKMLVQVRHLMQSARLDNINTLFVRGFISGWYKVKPRQVSVFLDKALYDVVWQMWFPQLQLQITLDDVGYKRLLKSLELDNIPTWQYKYLESGCITDSLTMSQLFNLVNAIASKSNDGLMIAIEILAMVIYCSKEKSDNHRQDLATVCISFIHNLDWSKIQSSYSWNDHNIEVILDFALTASKSEDEISEILHNLVACRRSGYNHGKFLTPFFKFYPNLTLDAVYVTDDEHQYQTASWMIKDWDSDEKETAVRHVPVDILIKWCEISPEDRYIFAAHTCHLFDKQISTAHEIGVDLNLSSAAVQILAGAKDKEAVLQIFIDRFTPNICQNSRSTILKKRLSLLKQLNPTHNNELSIEIAKVEEALIKMIEVEEVREDTEERNMTGSFE